VGVGVMFSIDGTLFIFDVNSNAVTCSDSLGIDLDLRTVFYHTHQSP